MITERTFTVTASLVQHEGTPLPMPFEVESLVAKALTEKYPNRSIHVTCVYKDHEYGKESK